MTNEWGGRPLPVSATCFHHGVLSVRLSGAVPAVKAAIAKIGGDPLPDEQGEAFWRSLRDQMHPHFARTWHGKVPLWRLSVRSSAPHAEFPGEQLIEWGGALRWLVADPAADPAALRAWARDQGGHATLFRAADKSAGAFHPLSPTTLGLHRRLKAVFDPAGILNPGRLYAAI
jgi:glycolate oxidase FAD binding subunit